jgi:hypothetical protein
MAEENLNTENENVDETSMGTTSQNPMLDDPYSLASFERDGTTNLQNFLPITDGPPQVDISSETTLPFYKIRDNVTGFPPYSPGQIPKNPHELADASALMLQNRVAQTQDFKEYSKPYMYDATSTGAHRARYLAYGQETFDRIGFNPMINNEEHFNKNTTIYDDFVRMGTQSFLPMFGLGFVAGPKSYGQIAGGDFGQDVDLADEYEEYNAIGMSTKGGVGGFVNNTFNSVSYSAGVLTEAVLENALIGAIEGAIVGGPAGALAGATGGGIFGLVRSIPKLGKSLFQMAKYGGKMSGNIASLRKYSKARAVWQAAGKNTINYINPLGNTTRAMQRNVFTNADNLSNLARGTRTAAGFWRDVNMINAALSEGRLEGGFIENQNYTKGYDEFWKRKGRAPNAEEQLNLRKMAKHAGFLGTWKNTLLINYTNKLAFPNLFRGSLMKGASYRVGRVNELFGINYKAAAKKAATEGGKNIGKYELVDYNLKNALKGLIQPKNYGRASANYFKLNVVEGVQEVLQDVIAKDSELYYVETYFDPTKENVDYSMATLSAAFGTQFSEQGFETFLSGFFMGALLRPINTVSQQGFFESKFGRFYKSKEKQDEYQDLRKNHAQDIVDAMNRLNDPEQVFNDRVLNYSQQALIAKDNNRDDIDSKQLKDNVTTSLVTDVVTVLKAGTYNVWLDNFKQYNQLDAKGFEDAANLEPGQGTEAMKQHKQFIKRAERIKSRYEFGVSNIASQKVSTQNLKKGSPEYDKATIYNKALDVGMWNMVFFQESFDDSLEQLNDLYSSFDDLKVFSNLPGASFQNISDLNRLNNEIEMLNGEIGVLQDSQKAAPTSALKDQIESKIGLRNALVNFQEAQREWTVETTELLRNAFKKQKESGEDIDIEKALEEVVNTYEQYDPNVNYKNKFEELIQNLSENDVEYHKMISESGEGKVDELYTKLLHVHALQKESQNLVPFINLLLDPKGFAEHINRNFEWMNNLWLTRNEYYKNAVNNAIEKKEYNDLLWSLSQDNIYIDLDEFGKWIEDKENYIPKEFIDVSEGQERIIPRGSMLFDKYFELFSAVTRMQKVKAAGEESNLPEQRDKAVADLLVQKETELKEARENYESDVKIETGSTVEEVIEASEVSESDPNAIKMQKARILILEKEKEKLITALENLTSENIADLNTVLQQIVKTKLLGFDNSTYTTEYETILLPLFNDKLDNNPELNSRFQNTVLKASEGYSDFDFVEQVVTDGFAFIDLINEEVSELTQYLEKQEALKDVTKQKIEDTQSYKDYQKVLDELNAKYEGLIEEVNKSFRDKGMVTEESEIAVTTSNKWDSLPQDLKDELQPLFDKRLNDPTLKDENAEEYERRRQTWFESQASIVNAYNDKKNAERLEAEIDAVTIKEPKLKFKAVSKVSDKSVTDIQGLIDTYKGYLEKNIKPKGRYGAEKLTKKEIENLNNDIEELEILLDKKRRTFQSLSEYTEVVKLFKDRVLDRQSEIEEVEDEAGNTIRLIGGKKSKRVTTIASEIDQDVNDRKPFVFPQIDPVLSLVDNALEAGVVDSVKQFITSFKNLNFKEFINKEKYTQLENALRKDGLTKENVKKYVTQFAYQEGREGGNAVDVTAKDFFTLNPEGGFMVPTKPDNMSQKAFDQLYGKNGILTQFRDEVIEGDFQIIGTSNLLFDTNLGISGETDLIAVNPAGEFKIIDIKALGSNSWKYFNSNLNKAVVETRLREEGLSDEAIAEHPEMQTFKNKFSDRDKYTYQQSLYRNLFYRMTGKIPKIAILPVQLKYDRKTGSIIEATTPKGILTQGKSVLDLNYKSEVEKHIPLVAPTFTETSDGTEVFEAPIADDTFFFIEEYTESTKLKDNLNKVVVYEGNIGTLILTPEGNYGVQFSGKAGTVVIDVFDQNKAVTDGNATFDTVAIGKVMNIENLGQVSTIEGVEVDAKFTDKLGNRAVINNVDYEVNRDSYGKIVSLTYKSNDKMIDNLIEEIELDLKVKIASEEKYRNVASRTTAEKDGATMRISAYRLKINELTAEISKLEKTNSKRTARGGNANAMIFALNRLPSNFTSSKQQNTQEEELDSIKRLATVSDAVFDGVTAIMMNQYPAKLDQLIDKGPSGLSAKDYLAIKFWSEGVLTQLGQLESQIINRGDLVTYVTGVKNQIIELQNNIELIKLTKDGKTVSTKQPEARKVFGTKAEVPFRFDISNVQRTDGGSTEGIPGSKRQPTKREAEEIIEEVLEKPKAKTESKISLAEVNLLEKIKTLNKNNFVKERANILIQSRNNKNISGDKVLKALNEKQLDIERSVEDVVEDSNVISKTPIFDSETNVVMKVTKKFKNGNVNLENIDNPNNTLKLTMEELKDQFYTFTAESPAFEEKVIEVSPEEEGNLEESKATVAKLTKQEIDDALNEDSSEDDDLNFLKNRPCKN